MNDFIETKVKPVAKLWVAVGGAVLASASTLIPEPWNTVLVTSISVATAISVYAVPNTPAPDPTDVPGD